MRGGGGGGGAATPPRVSAGTAPRRSRNKCADRARVCACVLRAHGEGDVGLGGWSEAAGVLIVAGAVSAVRVQSLDVVSGWWESSMEDEGRCVGFSLFFFFLCGVGLDLNSRRLRGAVSPVFYRELKGKQC